MPHVLTKALPTPRPSRAFLSTPGTVSPQSCCSLNVSDALLVGPLSAASEVTGDPTTLAEKRPEALATNQTGNLRGFVADRVAAEQKGAPQVSGASTSELSCCWLAGRASATRPLANSTGMVKTLMRRG